MKKVEVNPGKVAGEYEFIGEDNSHMMNIDGEIMSLEKGDVVKLSAEAAVAFKDRFKPVVVKAVAEAKAGPNAGADTSKAAAGTSSKAAG